MNEELVIVFLRYSTQWGQCGGSWKSIALQRHPPGCRAQGPQHTGILTTRLHYSHTIRQTVSASHLFTHTHTYTNGSQRDGRKSV